MYMHALLNLILHTKEQHLYTNISLKFFNIGASILDSVLLYAVKVVYGTHQEGLSVDVKRLVGEDEACKSEKKESYLLAAILQVVRMCKHSC